MIYFTSDLHFCHDRAFVYQPRGFNSIQEHNETIISNWNTVVNNDDEVYILGDLMLNDNVTGLECINKLKGKKYFVAGNHDSPTRIRLYEENGLINLGYAHQIKYKGYTFYMSHFPTMTGNFDADKPLKTRTISLCGHSHYQNKFEDMDKGLIYHCELDAHNCHPVNVDNIIEDIKNYNLNN